MIKLMLLNIVAFRYSYVLPPIWLLSPCAALIKVFNAPCFILILILILILQVKQQDMLRGVHTVLVNLLLLSMIAKLPGSSRTCGCGQLQLDNLSLALARYFRCWDREAYFNFKIHLSFPHHVLFSLFSIWKTNMHKENRWSSRWWPWNRKRILRIPLSTCVGTTWNQFIYFSQMLIF